MAAAEADSISFAEATRVDKIDSHTYRVNLDEAFCLGNVPNGGYMASCMLAAATTHLSARTPPQPHALTAHFEFPRRAAAGPAEVHVDEVKLGAQLSTLHLILWQGAGAARRRVVLAYVVQTDLRRHDGGGIGGFSLPTGFETTPAAGLPQPVPDLASLGTTTTTTSDSRWERFEVPRAARAVLRSMLQWEFYMPRPGVPATAPGVLDMWTRLASGERISQAALAYVVDSFPHNLHEFLAAPELRELLHAARRGEPAADDDDRARHQAILAQDAEVRGGGVWFATVALNVEAKAALPEEGVEWLAVRVTSKQIRDGRWDMEVSVRDARDGTLLAMSPQVGVVRSGEKKSRAAL